MLAHLHIADQIAQAVVERYQFVMLMVEGGTILFGIAIVCGVALVVRKGRRA
jgi:hypothetical protein